MEKIGQFSYKPAKFDEITSDTLLLAAFIPPLRSSDSLLDIGTGSGALPIMLADRDKGVKITGIEVQPSRVEAAIRNVERNGLRERITILKGDYRTLAGEFSEGAFTHVVSNPPYVRAGSGRPSSVRERQVARSEVFGGLADLVRVAARLIGESGRFFIVFTALRKKELLKELGENALSPVRIRFIHTKEGEAASRLLVEAVLDPEGKIALVVEAPIVLS